MITDSHPENFHVREHAEPYNRPRQASPSSSRHSRTRSGVNSGSTNRSGTVGSRLGMITRPSTSHGARDQSPHSVSGGPQVAMEEPPPLPLTVSGNAARRATLKARRAGFLGITPRPPREGGLTDRTSQRRPVSPNRAQTFPPHNEDRLSGDGPNRFMARRPSQPAPTSPTGRSPTPGTTSLLSSQRPESASRTYNPPNQGSQPQTQPSSYPPRTASRISNRPVPGHRPFPVRSSSRTDIRVNFGSSNAPPLPAQNTISNHNLTNQFHKSTDSSSSDVSSLSVAQPGSPRPILPTAKNPLAREQSDRKQGNDAAYTPLPDVALPPQPSFSSFPLEFPTDPLCLQDRLSLMRPGSRKRSPFSTSSSSSSSSRACSLDQSSQGPPNRRGTVGANKGICRGCLQPITASQKSISSKDGRLTGRYHKECFACHTCHGPFETADVYIHDDHPFCAEHYHALNGSLCTGCGRGIEGQYLEASNMKDTEAEKYHPECLTCSSCSVSLQNDYYEWKGKAYCERDAKLAAGVPLQSPNEASLTPGSSAIPGSTLSSDPSRLSRPGLPAGPRAGLRPPGLGEAPRSGNGFLPPFPPNNGTRALQSGGRFPERRTTKLMMI